jgi:serine/threonine-protein kinase HipA
VNPIPYGEYLALNVSEDDSSIDFELAISTAEYYGISNKEAKKYVKEISTTVAENWEKLAVQYGISRRGIEKMRPAFSACYY